MLWSCSQIRCMNPLRVDDLYGPRPEGDYLKNRPPVFGIGRLLNYRSAGFGIFAAGNRTKNLLHDAARGRGQPRMRG
jgi:hypothetical protein